MGGCHTKQRSKVWAVNRARAVTLHTCMSSKSCAKNKEAKNKEAVAEGIGRNGMGWVGT